MTTRTPTVLITGASGSLGYRLAEVLSLHMSVPIIALAHRVASAGRARLARLPCSVITGDVTKPEEFSDALAQADVVVHCAHGTHGDADHRWHVTVEGTRRMLEAASKNHVQKFIHLSTAAVVGYKYQSPAVDETAPYRPCGDTYIDSKIEAEKIALSYTGHLPVAILRPTRIYGPRCESWTVWPLSEIRQGRAWLTDGGPGICPLAYVDNVAEAIICAIVTDSGDGEVFFVTDEEEITWARFYGDYCQMIGPDTRVWSLSSSDVRQMIRASRLALWQDSLRGLGRMGRSGLRQLPQQVPVVRRLLDLLPQPIINSVKRAKGALRDSTSRSSGLEFLLKMDPGTLQRYADAHTSQSAIVIDKLKTKLGYRQIVSYADGIRLTGKWARYARLTDG